jgi:hypothetical protein
MGGFSGIAIMAGSLGVSVNQSGIEREFHTNLGHLQRFSLCALCASAVKKLFTAEARRTQRNRAKGKRAKRAKG